MYTYITIILCACIDTTHCKCCLILQKNPNVNPSNLNLQSANTGLIDYALTSTLR